MLNNIIELADNKLLILYIIKKLKTPCSNSNITDIILNNNFLNYFILQQYLNDLVEGSYLNTSDEKNEIFYKISPKGKKILEMFQNRISQFKIDCFKNYMKSLNEKNSNIDVDIKHSKKSNNFVLEVDFSKNNQSSLNLNIVTNSKDDLEVMIKNCKTNNQNLYNSIISLLLDKK